MGEELGEGEGRGHRMKARGAASSLSPSMGEVLGRCLRRLPLSRRAARVDLSHKGRGGLHLQGAHARYALSLDGRGVGEVKGEGISHEGTRLLSPSPLMGEGLGRG